MRAGYSTKTANEQASRLLSNVMVQQAISERTGGDQDGKWNKEQGQGCDIVPG
ncbi:MAG: terminase small subunit [Acetatifactor sp.]|nr:terminase small subunit [Acetatifactor sp.]